MFKGFIQSTQPTVSNIVYVDSRRKDIYSPDGSINAPFKTIQEGIAHSQPNATVYIMPGNYIITETLNLKNLTLVCHDIFVNIFGSENIIPFTLEDTSGIIGGSIYSINTPAIRTIATGTGLIKETRLISSYINLTSTPILIGAVKTGCIIAVESNFNLQLEDCPLNLSNSINLADDQFWTLLYQSNGIIQLKGCIDDRFLNESSIKCDGAGIVNGLISLFIQNGSSEINLIENKLTLKNSETYNQIGSLFYAHKGNSNYKIYGGNYIMDIPTGTPTMYTFLTSTDATTKKAIINNTSLILKSNLDLNKFLSLLQDATDELIINNTNAISQTPLGDLILYDSIASVGIVIGTWTGGGQFYATTSILPGLTQDKLWIGDASNLPAEQTNIAVLNLPNLTSGKVWQGDGTNRPVEVVVAGGTDEKVKITATDTTTDFLTNKILITTNKLTKTVQNPAGNENILLSTGTDILDKAIAAQINGLTEKTKPINADLLLIEDSADSNNKKKIQIGNLPRHFYYEVGHQNNASVSDGTWLLLGVTDSGKYGGWDGSEIVPFIIPYNCIITEIICRFQDCTYDWRTTIGNIFGGIRFYYMTHNGTSEIVTLKYTSTTNDYPVGNSPVANDYTIIESSPVVDSGSNSFSKGLIIGAQFRTAGSGEGRIYNIQNPLFKIKFQEV